MSNSWDIKIRATLFALLFLACNGVSSAHQNHSRIGNSTAQIKQNFPSAPDFRPQNHKDFSSNLFPSQEFSASTPKIGTR